MVTSTRKRTAGFKSKRSVKQNLQALLYHARENKEFLTPYQEYLIAQDKNFDPLELADNVKELWNKDGEGTWFLDVEFASAGFPASGFGIYAGQSSSNDNRLGFYGSTNNKIRVLCESDNDNRLDQTISNDIFKNYKNYIKISQDFQF